MRQPRPSNYERLLDRLQEEAEQAENEHGIFELFDRDDPERQRDEDAPLDRDGDK